MGYIEGVEERVSEELNLPADALKERREYNKKN